MDNQYDSKIFISLNNYAQAKYKQKNNMLVNLYLCNA